MFIRTNTALVTTVVLVIVLFLGSGGANAMGKMYLFSNVRGLVQYKGQPVPGAIVQQEFRWAWKGEVGREEVKTDAKGEFSFPVITRTSFFGSLLPHEPMIQQTILIKHGGQTYKAWMFDKGDYASDSELNGKPIFLFCDLDSQPSHKGSVYGICELR